MQDALAPTASVDTGLEERLAVLRPGLDPTLDPSMLASLIAMTIAFTFLYAYLMTARVDIERRRQSRILEARA